MSLQEKYDIVIGLEVHAQLQTNTKLFCSCLNKFGCKPNENTCPVCLGLPGALPVLNQKAFDFGIKTALALGSKIAETTKFDRKHYFYPDLPKGYQISQYDEPYCSSGGVQITVDGKSRFIELERIHMEEDAGKLSHSEDSHIEDSLVDLNRAGTPLLEIVTLPVMYTPAEAYQYLTELKQILLYIEISDCNMQEGSLRCDANISLKPKGQVELGTKVEVKNMNSFRGVQAALEHEIKRQYFALENNEVIVQETRLYDVDRGVTRPMRSKEQANDYRYFPEPDLPRFAVSADWIAEVKTSLCELPQAKKARFKKEYNLPEYDIESITQQKRQADYFEECAKLVSDYKLISNWMMGEVQRELSERKIPIEDFEISPQKLAGLLKAISEDKISKKIAKEKVFPEMLKSDESAEEIVSRLGLEVQSDNETLRPIVLEAIAQNQAAIEDFRGGKKKALGALVGFCMKKTQGKASPGVLNQMILEELNSN